MHTACTTLTCSMGTHTPTFSTRPLPHPLPHSPSLPLFVSFMTSPSLSATSTDPNTLSRNFYSKDQCFRFSTHSPFAPAPHFILPQVCLSLDQSLHQWTSISSSISHFQQEGYCPAEPKESSPRAQCTLQGGISNMSSDPQASLKSVCSFSSRKALCG